MNKRFLYITIFLLISFCYPKISLLPNKNDYSTAIRFTVNKNNTISHYRKISFDYLLTDRLEISVMQQDGSGNDGKGLSFYYSPKGYSNLTFGIESFNHRHSGYIDLFIPYNIEFMYHDGGYDSGYYNNYGEFITMYDSYAVYINDNSSIFNNCDQQYNQEEFDHNSDTFECLPAQFNTNHQILSVYYHTKGGVIIGLKNKIIKTEASQPLYQERCYEHPYGSYSNDIVVCSPSMVQKESIKLINIAKHFYLNSNLMLGIDIEADFGDFESLTWGLEIGFLYN